MGDPLSGADKIKFFAVVKGSCWVCIDGEEEPFHAGAGDVGLLAAQRSFVLASDLMVAPVDAMSLFAGSVSKIAKLGDSDDFSYVGGHILLDPVSGQLLADVLPPGFTSRLRPRRQPASDGFSTNLSRSRRLTCRGPISRRRNSPNSSSYRSCVRT